MSFAPQQNWPAYHAIVEQKQIAKDLELSDCEKLQRYAALHDLVLSLRDKRSSRELATCLCDENILQRRIVLQAYRNVTGPFRG